MAFHLSKDTDKHIHMHLLILDAFIFHTLYENDNGTWFLSEDSICLSSKSQSLLTYLKDPKIEAYKPLISFWGPQPSGLSYPETSSLQSFYLKTLSQPSFRLDMVFYFNAFFLYSVK